MKDKISKQMENDRTNGLRPVVVACILNKGKILFVYQREYSLWQLPQGGVEPNEELEEALARELKEELGVFSEKIDTENIEIIGEDKIEFPKDNQGTRELRDSKGNPHFMIGKKYYFIVAKAKATTLDIEETEFEKYRWTTIEDASKLTSQIYQKGKRRITLRALELIKEII